MLKILNSTSLLYNTSKHYFDHLCVFVPWIDGTVYVQWDIGIRAIYPYGCDGLYSVVVCNEPRFSLDGLADVGCLVERGNIRNEQI